ncbi:MAG: hypothetical protein Q7S27_00195 [Nanoarchaeota archaeon]|nr:hypothetical protein [Nanoarchaeota archaeon]
MSDRGKVLYVENPYQYESGDQKKEEERGKNFRAYFERKGFEIDHIKGLNMSAVKTSITTFDYDFMVTHLFAITTDDGRDYHPAFSRIKNLKIVHLQTHNKDIKVILYTGANINEFERLLNENITGTVKKSSEFNRDFASIERLLN